MAASLTDPHARSSCVQEHCLFLLYPDNFFKYEFVGLKVPSNRSLAEIMSIASKMTCVGFGSLVADSLLG
jgi:hypothetical protein